MTLVPWYTAFWRPTTGKRCAKSPPNQTGHVAPSSHPLKTWYDALPVASHANRVCTPRGVGWVLCQLKMRGPSRMYLRSILGSLQSIGQVSRLTASCSNRLEFLLEMKILHSTPALLTFVGNVSNTVPVWGVLRLVAQRYRHFPFERFLDPTLIRKRGVLADI